MTGSVQVKKGYWYTVIHLGERKYKWQSTGLMERGNKRKAEQILRERMAEHDSKKDVPLNKDVPFHKFMEEWLDVIKTQVEPITYNGYKMVVQNQIAPYFKSQKVSLQDLQTIHIQKFYAKRLRDGVSANTVKHYHANIHKALNYAVKTRLITHNPASLVELPKKEKFVGSTYSESQMRQLIELVRGTEIEAAIMFSVSYGLRRSEVIGLKWSAIDFDRKTVAIEHTVTGGGKNLICANKTKNKSSYRTLPLIDGLDKYLLQLKQHQQEMKSLLGNAYIDSDYVCRWNDGKLILPNHLSKKFKAIIKANGLPVIRLHDLRHSAASMLIAEGFNLKQVSEFLGHCDIGTTANIYAHLQFQSKIDMGSRMSEKLFA